MDAAAQDAGGRRREETAGGLRLADASLRLADLAMRAFRWLGRAVRMRSPEGRCLDSLQRPPVALYSESIPLAVLFSPKAGTTFAVKWFFFQEGVLDEALAYAKWPHPYRQEVFYHRPRYLDKLAAIPSLGPRVIKFVRDPYDRAVSSYLHFCELSQRDDPVQARDVLAAIGVHLERRVGVGASFTFREFVSYLATTNLASANPHFRTQVCACERAGLLAQMRIVKIEESRDGLPRLEADLGLRHSDYEELRRSPHHTTRADLPGFFGDTPFGDTRDAPTPRTSSFYDEALVSEVGRLYAEDCEAYGYAPPKPTPVGG